MIEKSKEKIEEFAKELLYEQELTNFEVRKILITKGLDKQTADELMKKLKANSKDEYKERASRDIVEGVIIFGVAVFATMTSSKYIFIGAILAGLYKIYKGYTDKKEV